MTYQSEVLADSPRLYLRCGDADMAAAIPVTATASSNFSFNPPSMAIDGEPRPWITNATATGWVRLEYASAVALTKYQIWHGSSSVNRAPKNWTFEGSNDGSAWTTVDTQTNQTAWSQNEVRSYTFSNSTGYLYYRLNVSANNGDTYLEVGELVTAFLADSSGNGRDFGVLGGVTYQSTGLLSDASAKSVTLNGSTGRANRPYSSWAAPTAITVEAVIKTSASTGNRIIMARDGDTGLRAWQFRLNAGKLEFVTINGGAGVVTASDTTNIATGVVHHVAATYDASNIKLYIDGTLVKTQAASGALSTQQAPFRVGFDASGGLGTTAALWNGQLQELAFYPSDIGATRIAAHAAEVGSTTTTTGTVAATASAPTLSVAGTVTRTGQVEATAPAPTLTVAGDVPSVGQVTATASAPTLSVSGDVAGITSGTVDATASAPTLTVTGDVTVPITGSVAASASAPVLHVNDTPNDTFAASFSAGASLTASVTDIGTIDAIAATLQAGASLTVGTPLEVDLVSADFAAGARLDVVFPRAHTVDPVTGLPQYRLRVVQPDGTGVTELPNAAIGDIVEELNDDGSLDFSLPKYDATTAFVTPRVGEPIPEVQVWRGPNLEAWQKVDGANPDDQLVAFDCSGLMGYLKGRVIGKAPKRNLLVNPNFTDGLAHWSGGYLPGSIPASAPQASVVNVDFFGETRKALQITGAATVTTVKSAVETAAVFVPNEATLLPGGAAALTAAANDIPDGSTPIHIVGHTANDGTGSGLTLSLNRAIAAKPYVAAAHPDATISILPGLKSPNAQGSNVAGRGYYEPVASNATEAGRKQNRRVEFSYKSTVTAGAEHQQYFGQDITFTNMTGREVTVTVDGYFRVVTFLGVSGNSYGVQVQLVKASAPTVEVEESHSTIDENTPVGEWISHEASVTIPSNGQAYIIHVRYFPPEGLVQWTELGVWPDDALFFPTGTDQALIAQGLVEHAQDPAMDKEGDWPILIRARTPLTGVTRSRTYLYHERRYVSTGLEELQSLYNGMDMHIETDASTRTLVTSYPRRGQTTQVTLSLGGNVVAYRAPVDVTSVSTRRYVQGLDQSGANRREGVYTDTSGLGGLLVEEVEYAKPDTPVTELDETAISGVKRYGHPAALLEVTIGHIGGSPGAQADLTSWMLDRVGVGDVVNVDIQDGQTNITGLHRVTRKTLTPETDTLRYLLAPEV